MTYLIDLLRLIMILRVTISGGHMKLRSLLFFAFLINFSSSILQARHRIIQVDDMLIYLDDGKATSYISKNDRLKKKAKKTVDNEEQVELDKLGTESVSFANETFIKDIQHELGLDHINLTIRAMNDDAIALVGRENAFVIGEYDYLFVSEEWFNELTIPERRFLIGHELAHLMMQHSEKQQLAQQSMAILVNYLVKYIGNSAEQGTWKHYGIEAAKKIGFGTLKLLLLSMLSRGCESEADEVSARKLNSAQGGIALFERMDATRAKREESSWFLILVRKVINCFASHPQHDERIKFLQAIATQK